MKSRPKQSKSPVRAIAKGDTSRPGQRAKSTRTRDPVVRAGVEVAAAPWTFLTNYSHVLILLSQSPSMVLREVARQVGITERAVQRIVADLEAAGIIERQKIGRHNQYFIRYNQPLRHSVSSHRTIGELLAFFGYPEV